MDYMKTLANSKNVQAQMAKARAEYKGPVTKVAPFASAKRQPSKRQVVEVDVTALPPELRAKYFTK